MGLPVAVSHSRAVLSSLAVAMRVPSGLNATPHTELSWPVRVRRRRDGIGLAGAGTVGTRLVDCGTRAGAPAAWGARAAPDEISMLGAGPGAGSAGAGVGADAEPGAGS